MANNSNNNVHTALLIVFSYTVAATRGKEKTYTRAGVLTDSGEVVQVGKFANRRFFRESTFMLADDFREDQRFHAGVLPAHPWNDVNTGLLAVANNPTCQASWRRLIDAYEAQYEGAAHPHTWQAYHAYNVIEHDKKAVLLTREDHKRVEAAERRVRLNNAKVKANQPDAKKAQALTIMEALDMDSFMSFDSTTQQTYLHYMEWSHTVTEFLEIVQAESAPRVKSDVEIFDEICVWLESLDDNKSRGLKTMPAPISAGIMRDSGFPFLDRFQDWTEVSAFVQTLRSGR